MSLQTRRAGTVSADFPLPTLPHFPPELCTRVCIPSARERKVVKCIKKERQRVDPTHPALSPPCPAAFPLCVPGDTLESHVGKHCCPARDGLVVRGHFHPMFFVTFAAVAFDVHLAAPSFVVQKTKHLPGVRAAPCPGEQWWVVRKRPSAGLTPGLWPSDSSQSEKNGKQSAQGP